jgi:TonB family protein
MRGRVVWVLAGLLLAGGALAEDVITYPDWVRRPTAEEMRASWPAAAGRKGIGGKALISCGLDIQGLLKNCVVVSETPEGSGFGQSALLLAGSFKMTPKKINGKPVDGGDLRIRIPIVFEDPDGPIGGPTVGALTAPVWTAAPGFDDMAAAWPKSAGELASGGAVLRCTFNRLGKLTNCDTFNELPRGKGFGAAARTLVSKFALGIDPANPIKGQGNFVNVSFRFINPATPEGQLRKLSQPRWITTLAPDKVQAIFPKQAADAGVKAGKGVAECRVAADGHLKDCKVSREDPPGLGFGASAVLVAGVMQLNPWSDDGRPVDGAMIKLPVQFGLAPEPVAKP